MVLYPAEDLHCLKKQHWCCTL